MSLSKTKKTFLFWSIHVVVLAVLIYFDELLYKTSVFVINWIWIKDYFLLAELTKTRHWEFFKQFGSAWSGILISIFIWRYDREKRSFLLVLFIAAITSGILYHVINHSVAKVRPNITEGEVQYLPFPEGWESDGNLAFPSGHTAFAFCLATFLAYLFPESKWFFYTLAFLCGCSRVFYRAHFISDIYAGALLGYGVTLLAFYLFYKWTSRKPPGWEG